MADGLRNRKAAPDASERKDGQPAGKSTASPDQLTVLDVLRLIFGLILLSGLLSYFITGDSYTWGYKFWWLQPKAIVRRFSPPVLLTDAELKRYNGENPDLPIYLGLNGTLFDVTAGRRTYGPRGPYHYFAGTDAARAFITGCFKDDANPDLRGVEWSYIPLDVPRIEDQPDNTLPADVRRYRRRMVTRAQQQVRETLEGWAKVFRGKTGKDYFEVGRIVREENWLDNLPIKPLCEPAEKGRPETDAEGGGPAGKDPGEKFRKGTKR